MFAVPSNHESSDKASPKSGGGLWTPDDLRQLSTKLLLEMYRCGFSEPDRRASGFERIFNLITAGSYGMGRAYAQFNDLDHLVELLGSGRKNNAYAALKVLEARNVVHRVKPPKDKLRLWVNPNVEGWILRPGEQRCSQDVWKQKLADWAQCYKCLQVEFPNMPEPEKSIIEVMAEMGLMETSAAGMVGNSDSTSENRSPAVADQVRGSDLNSENRTPAAGPAIPVNVRSGVRDLTRSTCSAQERDRILQATMNFLSEDGRVDIDKERADPIWKRLASLPDWPSPLETCIRDILDSSTPTTTNRARRLVDAVKNHVGIERWLEVFPKSKAEWTR
jgi:hypothetical protein